MYPLRINICSISMMIEKENVAPMGNVIKLRKKREMSALRPYMLCLPLVTTTKLASAAAD